LLNNQSLDSAGAVLERDEVDICPVFSGRARIRMPAAAGPAPKDFLKGLWRIKGEAPAARQREMDISVIIPVYNEEAALPELYQALADILDRR
jgi:hypothetical protein